MMGALEERLERLGVMPPAPGKPVVCLTRPKREMRRVSYPYQFDHHVRVWRAYMTPDADWRDWLTISSGRSVVSVARIIEEVGRHYNVSRMDILSHRRTANVMRPRLIAVYLAKTLTMQSMVEIGQRFGGRDHTTILSAVRKITRLVQEDTALAAEIASLKVKIIGGCDGQQA